MNSGLGDIVANGGVTRKPQAEITPHITAKSRVGINGSSEIGIGWKRDY
jgi:hypothetical protein